MKIKSIFFSVLALVLILSSCNVATPSTPTLTPDSPTETKMSKPEPTVTIPNDQVLFPVDINASFTGDIENKEPKKKIGGLFTINNLFPNRQTIEDDVPKKITYKLGNTEYNLEYMWSAPHLLGLYISDMYVDFYKLEGSDVNVDDSIFAFKHKTTDVVYIKILPTFDSDFKIEFDTLEEYISYFSDILGNSVDLSEYKLTCTTYSRLKGTSERNVINGFVSGIAPNNEYRTTIFDFIDQVGDIDTGNKIHIIVTSGYFHGISIRNESTNYDYYSDSIGIYQNDIDLALSLTKKWAEQSFGECENLEFVYIKHLYSKPYIVVSFDTWSGSYYVYVDFQRMIQ